MHALHVSAILIKHSGNGSDADPGVNNVVSLSSCADIRHAQLHPLVAIVYTQGSNSVRIDLRAGAYALVSSKAAKNKNKEQWNMARALEGKVAVITGAGSGMGRSTAHLFHAEGASLVLVGRSGKEQIVAQELGSRAIGISADVGRAADVRSIIGMAVQHYGGIDILCSMAGIGGSFAHIVETEEEDFDELVSSNLKGVFLLMKEGIPHLLTRGGGSIVTVASTAVLIGAPGLGAYSATKGGVVALTRAAAIEYARQGIRANSICPGVIETPMYSAGSAANPEMAEHLKSLNPMGRNGFPEEVAAAALFLASDSSSYITGVVLPVDGGQVAT